MNNKNKGKNNQVYSASATQIRVIDPPLRIRLGLSTLSEESNDKSIDSGLLVSEVGPPTVRKFMSYPNPIPVYDLRAPRVNKIPSFIFGSTMLGEAYSAFLHQTVSAPAVGAKITINPVATPIQAEQFKLYKFISYDVTWIIHVPAPLGTGIYLKVYAPEVDETTETRGVRFKPSAAQTLAFSLPYSNDLSLVPVTVGRKGQCGGSIVIQTVEDNSIADLNTPMNITCFNLIHNVVMTGLIADGTKGVTLPSLNYQPVTNPPPPLEYHMDSGDGGEITAEVAGTPTDRTEDASPAVPIAPPLEKPVAPPAKPDKKAASSKPNLSQIGAKWFEYQTITVDSDSLNVEKEIVFNPYTFTQKGEAFNLPYKRHVWTTGARDAGYIHTVVFQVNIARPPQISGVIQFRDSANASSRYLVQFGEKAEIPCIPVVMDGVHSTKPRDWTTPWMRTSRCSVTLKYELIAFNRTTDIANTSIKIMVRLGKSQFQTPIKPIKRTPTPFAESMLIDLYRAIEDESDEEDQLMMLNYHPQLTYHMEDGLSKLPAIMAPVGLPPLAETSPSDFITPFPALEAEGVALHEEIGEPECLDLDEFPILAFDGEVDTNKVIDIPLNLPAILDIGSEDPSDNAITQKFDRFINIVPQNGGPFGPIVGNYTIKLRLPTTIAGEIVHVALPGDMADEAALMIFGLSSILSMAGSALSSVGGPLISGLVNTVAPVLNGLTGAIGGEGLGGLAADLLGSLTGLGKPKPPTPVEAVNPASTPAAITGGIPISRYVEFLKPILENYTTDPVLPTLLMQAQNFMGVDGSPLAKVPLQVLASMRNVNVEREAFNRTYEPAVAFAGSSLTLDSTMFPRIMEAFCNNPLSLKEGTRQNDWFKRFKFVLERNFQSRNIRKSITLAELRAIPQNLVDTVVLTRLFGAGEVESFGPSSETE